MIHSLLQLCADRLIARLLYSGTTQCALCVPADAVGAKHRIVARHWSISPISLGPSLLSVAAPEVKRYGIEQLLRPSVT